MKFKAASRLVVSFGVLACALGTAGSVSAGQGEDRFGAIAYSPDTRSYGWAYKKLSRVDAEYAAMGQCAKHGDDCRVATWFRNSCGALANGPKGWGAASAPSRAEAEDKAMNLCYNRGDGCKILTSTCA